MSTSQDLNAQQQSSSGVSAQAPAFAADQLRQTEQEQMTASETIAFCKKLFKDTFVSNPEYRNETLNYKKSLRTKAFVAHFVMMLSRIVYPILGVAYWQRGYHNRHMNRYTNQEFADATEIYVKSAIIGLVVVGVFLNLLVWRRREYADYIFYYELLSGLVQMFVPFDFGDFIGLVQLNMMVQNFILTACDLGHNTIASTVCILIMTTVQDPIFHGRDYSLGMVVASVLGGFWCFAFLTTVAMMHTYTAQIRGRVVNLVFENINLLNKMHEGLLVLTESDFGIKFASNPAISLLKQLPKQLSASFATSQISNAKSNQQSISNQDLNAPLFKLSPMSVINAQSLRDQENREGQDKEDEADSRSKVNLRSIIREQPQLDNESAKDQEANPSESAQGQIYRVRGKVRNEDRSSGSTESARRGRRFKNEYTMVRAKRINYLQKASIAIYFQDMSQYVKQIQLESQVLEEKNRNASLESYTSTISHEFRTPLGTSLMFLEQLLESELDPEVSRVLKLVITQLNLLLCLVDDVIDLKMIQEKTFESKMKEFSPLETLQFIQAIFRPQAEMVQVTVSFKTVSVESLEKGKLHGHEDAQMPEHPLPPQLIGDSLRLKQILINLVKNALKFTRNGSVRIFLAYDEEQQLLKCSVVDNGKGILAKDMPRLFSMFGKLLRTADMNNEGIGMGLMICKNLVEMNHGTIQVHSDGAEKGSTFTFTMRMVLQNATSSAERQDSDQSEAFVIFSRPSQYQQSRRLNEVSDVEEIKEPAHETSRALVGGIDTARNTVENDRSVSFLLQEADQLLQPSTLTQQIAKDVSGISLQSYQSEIEGLEEGASDAKSEIEDTTKKEKEARQKFEEKSNTFKQPEASKSHRMVEIQDERLLVSKPTADMSDRQPTHSTRNDKNQPRGILKLNLEEDDSDNKSILVVDDCPYNVLAVTSLLEQFELKSDFCNDGLAAIELVKKRLQSGLPMYKLILVDFSMPECDGPSCVTEILSCLGDSPKPTLAMITAYKDQSVKDIASEVGIDCFLVKPVFKQSMHKLLIRAGMIA